MLNSSEDAHRKSMSMFETDEHLQALMFVTPGSFTPPGRVMLQSSSPRLTASHKVAGSTSKVGKRVIGIVEPPKGSATIGFILAQLFGGFGAGPMELPRCEFRRRG